MPAAVETTRLHKRYGGSPRYRSPRRDGTILFPLTFVSSARRRAVIRPLTPKDADELAALLVENRAFLAPFEPDRNERFYTADGQRERLEREDQHGFAILDGERIAGTVALSNVVRGPLQSANLGYWVAERVNGRGFATNAVGELIPVAFGELGLHRLEAGTLVDNVASRRVLEKNGFEEVGIARRYLHTAAPGATTCCFSCSPTEARSLPP